MKNFGIGKLGILTIALFFILSNSCNKISDNPKYSPPSDHTISKDGRMHKSGYDNPTANCITCHGNDLKGGTSGVSCYECHGKKW